MERHGCSKSSSDMVMGTWNPCPVAGEYMYLSSQSCLCNSGLSNARASENTDKFCSPVKKAAFFSLHNCQGCWHKTQKTKQKTTSVVEDVAKWRLLCPVEGNVKWCSHLGKSMEVLNKTNNRIAVWSRNPVPGYLPKRIEIWVLRKYLNYHVHSSVIYSGQVSKEWKQPMCLMTDELIKQNVIYT